MENAVARYLEDKKDRLPSLYDWKFKDAIAAAKFGIQFKGTSWFEKTRELKDHLHNQVINGGPADHEAIATYFIRDWGGISRLSKIGEILALFDALPGTNEPPATFAAPFKRISSWSKWASIACPAWACIYDARVAYSLNVINYLTGGEQPLFPMPEGRNTRLKVLDINTLLLSKRLKFGDSSDPKHLKQTHFIPEASVYSRYLALLRNVSRLLWGNATRIHEVEMLLFALADRDAYQDVFERLAQP